MLRLLDERRRRTEDELELQTRTLAHVNDAVVAIDVLHRVTYWNRAAERLYGVAREEALGQPLGEAYPYEWVPREDSRAATEALAAAGCWAGENVIVKRNGERIHVESTVAVIADRNESCRGMIATIRDVGERKKAERELREARAALEKEVEERTQELRRTVAALSAEVQDRRRMQEELLQSRAELRALSQRVIRMFEKGRASPS
jgi:PAS domain S-box-containing protein